MLLTSAHWSDTTRLFTDPVNGLFDALDQLADAGLVVQLDAVVVNKTQMSKNAPADGLPFTSPQASQ